MPAPSPPSALLRVRLTPRAARERLAPGPDGGLVAHVTAPPVDGAANEALVELLARELGVGRRNVRVIAGAASRSKVIEVEGVASARVRALAAPMCAADFEELLGAGPVALLGPAATGA